MLSRFSRIQLFATLWTITQQAPLPMGFPRQEYSGELPLPSPRDLPDLGIEPMSPAWQADSLWLIHLGSPANETYSNFFKKEEIPKCLSFLCIVWRHSQKVAVHKPWRELLPELNHVGTLSFDFPTPELRKTVLLFKSPSLCYFVMVAWGDAI